MHRGELREGQRDRLQPDRGTIDQIGVDLAVDADV